jgi:protein phosphatase
MDLSQALQVAYRSDAGMVRRHNEDSVFVSAADGLAILADGMGGYNGGEVASAMATSLLSDGLRKALAAARLRGSGRDPAALREAIAAEIARANGAIYEAAQRQPEYAGMGTTLVLAHFHDDAMVVAHIGDSRLYRFRADRLEQLTRDHSLLQEQIDIGMITPEDARLSQNRNLVTRALGVDPVVEAEIRDYDALPGDVYLLCSDGLNDMVEESDILHRLCVPDRDLERTAADLVQMANDRGGRDNVSVILLRVLRPFAAAAGWWERLCARVF